MGTPYSNVDHEYGTRAAEFWSPTGHLLADPTTEFTDLGSDFYQRRIDRARRTTHLLRQLHALGYDVQLTEAAA